MTALRLHRLRRIPRDVATGLVTAAVVAGPAGAQTPLDRPDFEIPRFAVLAADTVRTAIGTIPHAPAHVRWRRRDDVDALTRPGLTLGVTVRDIDGDGDLDVYFARKFTWSASNGATETDRTPAGDPLPASELVWNEGGGRWRTQAVPDERVNVARHEWVDLDLDGDLDLVYLRDLVQVRVVILRNDDGRFVPWPFAAGVGSRLDDARAFVVDDLDRDGHPDVAVVSGAGITRLLGPALGPMQPEPVVVPGLRSSVAMQALRIAPTGPADLLVYDVLAHMGRRDDVVVLDAAGRVRPAPEDLAVPTHFGISRADVDGDGRLDLFLGASDFHGGRNTLLLATADGYRRLGAETGLHGGYTYTNGASWADVDHDGRLDLFQPRHAGETRPVRSEAFVQLAPDGDGPRFCALRGDADPSVVGASKSAAWFDADDDGDLDLLVGRSLDYFSSGDLDATRDLFFENVSTTGAWLQVDVRTTAGTPRGTRVTVHAGGRSVVRFVGEGGTRGASANPLRLHFGLGAVTRHDGIDVRWPGGHEESWGPGPVDRRIRIREGASRGGR